MRAFQVVAAALTLLQVADSDSSVKMQITELINKGTSLLADEIKITNRDLITESEVEIMLNNLGFAWQSEQQRFQAQLFPMLDRYRELSPEARDEVNSLVRFNNLLANSITALILCNKDEAVWRIGVASQFLAHVKDDTVKQAPVEWHPDIRADPKAVGACK